MMEPPLAVCRVGGPWRRATWIRRVAGLWGRLEMNVRPARRSGLPAVRRSRRDRAGPGDLVVLIHVPLPGEITQDRNAFVNLYCSFRPAPAVLCPVPGTYSPAWIQ